MNILLLYTTNSGGTEMVASDIVGRLSAHKVTMKRVTEATPEEITGYDAVIMGSPTWDYASKDGQPHEDFLHFKEKAGGKSFENKPFVIFGLGDSSYRVFCGAVDEMEKWVTEWKGKLAVPSLKIDKFFYQQSEAMQKVEEWSKKLLDVWK